jgi:hypothetical protein
MSRRGASRRENIGLRLTAIEKPGMLQGNSKGCETVSRSRLHRMALMWTIATMAHLPFPLLDCDDLHRGPSVNSGQWNAICTIAERYLVHIDLIVLGSDYPDDPDEGPFDTTPDGGNAQCGPYPIFLGAPTGSDLLRQGQVSGQIVLKILFSDGPDELPQAVPVHRSSLIGELISLPLLHSSTTVLRC